MEYIIFNIRSVKKVNTKKIQNQCYMKKYKPPAVFSRSVFTFKFTLSINLNHRNGPIEITNVTIVMNNKTKTLSSETSCNKKN